MIAKTITYTDYNGVEHTDTYHFHLKASKLAESSLVDDEDFEAKIKKLIEEKNKQEIMRIFKEILSMSYGVKSEDGKTFKQSPELFAEFEESEAYDELFIELMSSGKAAADFFDGIIPKDLGKRVEALKNNK